MDKIFSSKEVAEVLGKRHDNLLRAIRKYCEVLGECASKYFTPEGSGRKVTYQVTRLGCDLLAGRMIGQAGEEFKIWYKGAVEDPAESIVPEVTERLYTVAEAVNILGMSERSVYRNIQIGKLEAIEREVMIPAVRKFVTVEALEKFKAEREG